MFHFAAIEAKAGRERSKTVLLEGDIEGDATSLRKTFIAGRNKHYVDLVQKIRRKHPPVKEQLEVYRMDIRSVGICVRGGPMAMVFLPPRLVQKSSVPPMETTEEVLQSNLLDQIPKRRKVILFSDGAGAWPAALTKKGVKFTHNEQVVHCKKQFVAHVQKTDQRSQQSGRNYVHRFPMGTSQNLAAQAVTYEAARRI